MIKKARILSGRFICLKMISPRLWQLSHEQYCHAWSCTPTYLLRANKPEVNPREAFTAQGQFVR